MRNPYSETMGATGGLGAQGPATGQAGIPYAGGLGNSPTGNSNWLGSFEHGLGSPLGLAGGALGGMLGSLFGQDSGPDPMSYLSQIPGEVSPYMKPYSTAGAGMLGPLEQQYQGLTEHPGEMLNKIGGQFHQSPGFNFAMQQAMQGAGHAAAAGGMAGSPEAMQQSQQVASQLGNQDYYNWLNKAQGMYGSGLQGMQRMAGMGMQAGTNMAEMISQALSAQGQQAQEQQAASAQSGGGMGGILGDIASAAMNFA